MVPWSQFILDAFIAHNYGMMVFVEDKFCIIRVYSLLFITNHASRLVAASINVLDVKQLKIHYR